MEKKAWGVEVRYRIKGQWREWEEWSTQDRQSLRLARRFLRERADYEAWQEGLGLGIDNSDRDYRLRNVESGEIITADRLRFFFGARETAANRRHR